MHKRTRVAAAVTTLGLLAAPEALGQQAPAAPEGKHPKSHVAALIAKSSAPFDKLIGKPSAADRKQVKQETERSKQAAAAQLDFMRNAPDPDSGVFAGNLPGNASKGDVILMPEGMISIGADEVARQIPDSATQQRNQAALLRDLNSSKDRPR